MPRCTRKGCLKEYDEADNAEGSCSFHPGGPVFHEGLKSWSCCKDINKPVLEFDQFMALPPCATGTHTSEAPQAAPAAGSSSASVATYVDEDGKEVYGVAPKPPTEAPAAGPSAPVAPSIAPVASSSSSAQPTPTKAEIEQDDLSLPVPDDAPCKRLGCKARWQGEAVSRGDGEGSKCRFHPQAAIFHEGSKGYLCCKRRVLEFDEFLKMEGCTEGTHLFVGAKKDEDVEEVVTCRIDHYQTPTTVHVSAFAKNADKSRSTVTFTPLDLTLSLYLPQNKRIQRTVSLYGPIDPAQCSYRILGTKVDITLVKPAPASWPLLELPPVGTELPPGYALTFGVSGRTGTVGGKEIVLSAEEMAKRG